MKLTSLNSGTQGRVRLSSANAVFVQSGDVYVAGNDGVTATTWKNLVSTAESVLGKGGAVANSVFVKQQ